MIINVDGLAACRAIQLAASFTSPSPFVSNPPSPCSHVLNGLARLCCCCGSGRANRRALRLTHRVPRLDDALAHYSADALCLLPRCLSLGLVQPRAVTLDPSSLGLQSQLGSGATGEVRAARGCQGKLARRSLVVSESSFEIGERQCVLVDPRISPSCSIPLLHLQLHFPSSHILFACLPPLIVLAASTN